MPVSVCSGQDREEPHLFTNTHLTIVSLVYESKPSIYRSADEIGRKNSSNSSSSRSRKEGAEERRRRSMERTETEKESGRGRGGR